MNYRKRLEWTARAASLALCAVISTNSALAQTARIEHQIVKQQAAPPTTGRDFWFAVPSNFWGIDEGGKYLNVYITSPMNTTAHVAIGGNGTPISVPVSANKIATYKLNESAEMESSGIPSSNAVHVWSADADLTVYFMSHNQNTSDGSYIIPTIGWGTDYVVAGYAALYELSADYPSEFTIAAEADSTSVNITPSCDLRQGTGPGASGSVVAYPAGQTFNVTLNRGQSIQFLSVTASGSQGYDVTGTIIHSSQPVGVIGGSMCTNIPAEFPYCDHVEHMLPPVRNWGKTYYSSSFVQPAGQQGHDWGLYLFVSSKPDQVIYKSTAAQSTQQECVISTKYGQYWDEIEGQQKFYSDAPFMLVEYINSASYPDNKNGYGDPAEVVIPSREQYSTNVTFVVPASYGGQQPYNNYVTVIVNVKDEHNTKFDGTSILSFTSKPIDDTFDVFTIPLLKPGGHIISGDSLGVGVYGYGYGYDESYAWSGPLGIGTVKPQDTVPPVAVASGACNHAFVHLADSGLVSSGIPQSKLYSLRVDSTYNMAYAFDSNWVQAVGVDTSGYGMSVIDPAKPAYLKVDAFDLAGNETSVISTYAVQAGIVQPPLQDFGTVLMHTTKYAYDTLINAGSAPFPFTELKLLSGNVGFTLDSGMTPPVLAVGEHRVIKIAFESLSNSIAVDSLIFGDACSVQGAALVGNRQAIDFTVSNEHWLNEPMPPPANGYIGSVSVHNFSTIPITIDSGWWPDKRHFIAVDTFPFTVPASSIVPFRIAYLPDDSSELRPDRTQGSWTSPQVLQTDGKTESVRNDSLVGNAFGSSVAVTENSVFSLAPMPNPVTGPTVTFEVSVDERSSSEVARITLTVYDALGREVGRANERSFLENVNRAAGSWQVPFDVSKLPNGTYTCRLIAETGSGQHVISKSFVIER